MHDPVRFSAHFTQLQLFTSARESSIALCQFVHVCVSGVHTPSLNRIFRPRLPLASFCGEKCLIFNKHKLINITNGSNTIASALIKPWSYGHLQLLLSHTNLPVVYKPTFAILTRYEAALSLNIPTATATEQKTVDCYSPC